MNVSFYLEDAPCKKEKLLAGLLAPGGNNDFHDGKYSSPMGGSATIGLSKNFRMLNPWVSIKDAETPREEKLRFMKPSSSATPPRPTLYW